MYLQNKYTRWYYNIIQRAQSRTLPADVYIEKHHIIPKSFGGKDTNKSIGGKSNYYRWHGDNCSLNRA